MTTPSRVWAIGRWEWEYEYDGHPVGRTDMLPNEGFFLLEADAYAHADYLNQDFRDQYVAEARRRGSSDSFPSFEEWAGRGNHNTHEVVEMIPGKLREERLTR